MSCGRTTSRTWWNLVCPSKTVCKAACARAGQTSHQQHHGRQRSCHDAKVQRWSGGLLSSSAAVERAAPANAPQPCARPCVTARWFSV